MPKEPRHVIVHIFEPGSFDDFGKKILLAALAPFFLGGVLLMAIAPLVIAGAAFSEGFRALLIALPILMITGEIPPVVSVPFALCFLSGVFILALGFYAEIKKPKDDLV